MYMESYTALAGFYDALMHDIDYDGWAQYLSKLLQKAQRDIKRIGEAACGTGNLTLRLKKAGYDIIATDASSQMLEIAAEKARRAGMRVIFSCQDMRMLQLPMVDAVICACDGVNYLAPGELISFFASAAGCIRPGGVLLFDLSSEYKLKQLIADNLFFEDGEKLSYFWRNMPNLQKGCVEMELTFFEACGDGLYRRQEEVQRQYWHKEANVKKELEKAGFQAEAFAFGTQDPPGAACERIQFFALRQ